jgi:hypothetical protein
MAAVLSSDMDKTDKVVTLIDECNRMGLTVEPPDVNASQYMFTVSGPKSIRYGLGAIKGVGQAAVENMLEERNAHGPFRDLRDLCRRLDLNKVNRRVLEALIRSGAADSMGGMRYRSTLMHQLPAAMQAADQSTRAREAGQEDLFGLAEPVPAAATRVAAEADAKVMQETLPNGARPSASRASAKRWASISQVIRSPNTSVSCGRSPAGALRTLAARNRSGPGARKRATHGALRVATSPLPGWCWRSASAVDAPASSSTIAVAGSRSRCSRTSTSSSARWSPRTRSWSSRVACAGTTSSTIGA